jgi:hypothetical protein
MEDEIGAYKNIRFVSSTNAKIFPDAATTLRRPATRPPAAVL